VRYKIATLETIRTDSNVVAVLLAIGLFRARDARQTKKKLRECSVTGLNALSDRS
jgi:hypothetical protein